MRIGLVVLSASPIIFLLSCTQHEEDKKLTGIESGVFDDFKYPEKYASVVNKAENGDKKSVEKLSSYYSSYPEADLRNLEYWSEKLFKFDGPSAYTNLILVLVANNKCDRAWEIVRNRFINMSDFPFYKYENNIETIDGKCHKEK